MSGMLDHNSVIPASFEAILLPFARALCSKLPLRCKLLPPIMPSNVTFVSGKSKEAEMKRINKELANIRNKFKGKTVLKF